MSREVTFLMMMSIILGFCSCLVFSVAVHFVNSESYYGSSLIFLLTRFLQFLVTCFVFLNVYIYLSFQSS